MDDEGHFGGWEFIVGAAVGAAVPKVVGAVSQVVSAVRTPLPKTNSLLKVMDDGHLCDSVMAGIEDHCALEEDLPPVLAEMLGGATRGYARWAARLASEYKLEFGIPKRTAANRMVVRETLHKRLAKKNTRHVHIRSVLPLAVELVFLKDEADLELDRLMQQPEMVARARQSVVDYWDHTSWASWLAAKVLPNGVRRGLERAFPGTFRSVPGFQA